MLAGLLPILIPTTIKFDEKEEEEGDAVVVENGYKDNMAASNGMLYYVLDSEVDYFK